MRCPEEPFLVPSGVGVNLWCPACEFGDDFQDPTVADVADARIRHNIRELQPHPALDMIQEKFIYPKQTTGSVGSEHKPEYRWI